MKASSILALALMPAAYGETARFTGITRYLNGAKAAVTHTIDDTTSFVAGCVDTMDKYGIKATVFVSTAREPIGKLWPRLQQAIDNGHEIGSHSRKHQCKWPDDEKFCSAAYSEDEIAGSRDDILTRTNQPHVWSWCYPCGNCASKEFVQRRLQAAGYILARNYPDEANDGHVVPDVNGYADNPFDAAYTQVVQKKGGIAKSGNTDVAKLNAKFDEVYRSGGIYNFMSHPQWLDYGSDAFYEQHMAYIARKPDVWYVPMGPLYAYKALREQTQVKALKGKTARFEVVCPLDRKIYNDSVTLEFRMPKGKKLTPHVADTPLAERANGITDRWQGQYFRRTPASLYVTVQPGVIVELK